MAGYTNGMRYVDMWAVKDLHPTNIELLQRLRSADDRQFGENMDVCGSVLQRDLDSRQWHKTGLIGIRSDVWSPSQAELQSSLNALQRQRRAQLRKSISGSGRHNSRQSLKLERALDQDPAMLLTAADLEKRRLVLKLFRTTGERSRWIGTIEELTTQEIATSLASNRPLLSMAGILSGSELITSIQQTHRTFRIPSVFAFSFYDEKLQRMWYINLLRKWISLGADFVVETEGKPIGLIDGKLIGLGYNAQITIHEPALAENIQFMDLLTLFATSIGYHRAIRASIKRRMRAAKLGAVLTHVIEDEELWLLKNPRRRAA